MVAHAWPERMMKDELASGRMHAVSSYEAAYLELTMRQGLPIATLYSKSKAWR